MRRLAARAAGASGRATLAMALAVIAPCARAADGALQLPVWHVGPYFGTAHNSPGGEKWGAIADRDHYMIGIRGSTEVLRLGQFSLAFAPEIVPFMIVTDNPTYRWALVFRDGSFRRVQVADGTAPVFGAGFSPMGTEAQMRLTPRLRAYVASAVGVVWFSREVPVANSKSYNYTIELGGGLLWELRPRLRLRTGYMFHHLSNGWSATENPGLDGDVFYVGWEKTIGR